MSSAWIYTLDARLHEAMRLDLTILCLQALLKRAKANSQAQLGQYDASSESAEAGERTYEKGYVY